MFSLGAYQRSQGILGITCCALQRSAKENVWNKNRKSVWSVSTTIWLTLTLILVSRSPEPWIICAFNAIVNSVKRMSRIIWKIQITCWTPIYKSMSLYIMWVVFKETYMLLIQTPYFVWRLVLACTSAKLKLRAIYIWVVKSCCWDLCLKQ